jgi:uncharacterized protein (TIGR02449 family)
MEEMLQHLEKHIKKLIDQHDQLKQANVELHKSKHLLVRDKDLILARQHKAISQIETLVSKLKAIEKL